MNIPKGTRCIKTYKGYQDFTSSLLRYDHQETTCLYEITEYTQQIKSYYDVFGQGTIKRHHHEVCYNDWDAIHQRIFYYNQLSCLSIQMLRHRGLLDRLKARNDEEAVLPTEIWELNMWFPASKSI